MKGVLIDTSVWVAHFRSRNAELVHLLIQDQALSQPMIAAELACGTPPAPREVTLRHIQSLQQIQSASLHEVMEFIAREKLYGLGCGLVDMVLLASTLITPGAALWTLDKHLHGLCERFNVAYQVSMD